MVECKSATNPVLPALLTVKSQYRMLKTNLSMKKMEQKQKEKNKSNKAKNDKFLINVNVIGSTGPIRFVVSEKDVVSRVIETSLKTYADEGRLPVLGTNASDFFLYSVAASEALKPSEAIGTHRGMNFMLCKKQIQPQKTPGKSEAMAQKGNGSWKAWLSKSFSFKMPSH